MARNQAAVGTYSIKTNFGSAFWVSNNDCASPSLEASIASGCHEQHNPFANYYEASALARMGEAAYDRTRLHAGLEWAGAHPGIFAWLTGWRAVGFWFPRPVYGWYAFWAWVVTAGSFAGLALLRRGNSSCFRLFIVVFLLYPLMYYVVVSEPRYRYPMYWMTLIAFGYAVERLRTRFAANRSHRL
jgi:hypothetical protein